MNETIRKILTSGAALLLASSFLLLTSCGPTITEAPQRQTVYTETESYGQVSASTLSDLEKQYPKDFYREQEKPVAAERQLSLGVSPFKGAGQLAQAAELATDVFTTTAVQSELFKVVERGEIERIAAELELGQSGLVDPATSMKIGTMTGMQLLLSGSLSDNSGVQRIDVKVIDLSSGEIILAEKMDGGIDSSSLGFMARQVVKKLANRYYQGQ